MAECAWIPGMVIASGTGVGLALAGIATGVGITILSYMAARGAWG